MTPIGVDGRHSLMRSIFRPPIILLSQCICRLGTRLQDPFLRLAGMKGRRNKDFHGEAAWVEAPSVLGDIST